MWCVSVHSIYSTQDTNIISEKPIDMLIIWRSWSHEIIESSLESDEIHYTLNRFVCRRWWIAFLKQRSSSEMSVIYSHRFAHSGPISLHSAMIREFLRSSYKSSSLIFISYESEDMKSRSGRVACFAGMKNEEWKMNNLEPIFCIMNFAFWIVLLLINIVAYLIMWIDKLKSIHRWWRVSERTLWILAIAGGVFGIWGRDFCLKNFLELFPSFSKYWFCWIQKTSFFSPSSTFNGFIIVWYMLFCSRHSWFCVYFTDSKRRHFYNKINWTISIWNILSMEDIGEHVSIWILTIF